MFFFTVSTEKKNKAITAKKIRAARSQLEKLACGLFWYPTWNHLVYTLSFAQLSTRSELLNQSQSQLYVRFIFFNTHIYNDSGRRESGTQEYLTRHAQDLDEIRGLWTAIVRRREALSVCLHPSIFVCPVIVGLVPSVSFY
jgi:hypothetical protein